MFSRFTFVVVTALALALTAACGDDDKKGDSNENNASSGNDSEKCDKTNPKGKSCTESKNCKVECSCANMNVSSGSCTAKSCEAPDCESACSNMDGAGDYQDKYCFVGEESEPEEKVELYGLCTQHSDCEGFSGDQYESEILCIKYCGNQFCSKNCETDSDCGIRNCDTTINSCIHDKYECSDGDDW